MLIVLQRESSESAIVRVQGGEVRFHDASARGLAPAKVRSYPSPERALSEAEKIVDHRLTMHARRIDELPEIDAGYRDLVRAVSFVRHHFLLWRERLRFQVSLELSAGAGGVDWAYRQWVPDQTLERGALGPDGVFVIHGDEVLRYESADVFRERFLQHVRALGDAAIRTVF